MFKSTKKNRSTHRVLLFYYFNWAKIGLDNCFLKLAKWQFPQRKWPIRSTKWRRTVRALILVSFLNALKTKISINHKYYAKVSKHKHFCLSLFLSKHRLNCVEIIEKQHQTQANTGLVISDILFFKYVRDTQDIAKKPSFFHELCGIWTRGQIIFCENRPAQSFEKKQNSLDSVKIFDTLGAIKGSSKLKLDADDLSRFEFAIFLRSIQQQSI
jgi:hypothetical protein